MNKIATYISALGVALGAAGPVAAHQGAEKLWETEAVLVQPESVAWDAERGVYYVSNLNGNPTEKGGTGFLSRLGAEGEVLEREWVSGLHAPKGLALGNGRLYAAEVGALVEIDPDSGEILARYPAEGSKMLNDVTLDDEGRVYVSDMLTDTLWRLDGESFEPWLVSETLRSPNGLHVVDGVLVVGTWGRMTEGFATEVPGHLLTVSLEDGALAKVGDGTPIGNLDGLEPDGEGGFLVTDWMGGGLLHVMADGSAHELVDFEQGSADIEFLPARKLVLVPLMNQNRVEAWQLR